MNKKQMLTASVAAIVGLTWVTNNAQAETLIKVVGLFKNAAVVQINGQQVMLKQGVAGPANVTLLSADTQAAVLKVDGKASTFPLGRQIGTQYQAPQDLTVVIKKDKYHQYITQGSINGLPVTLLVDTGATSVAMNEIEAKRLGLNYRIDGQEGRVVTASGTVRAWSVKLAQVKIGELDVPNVDASVVEGAYPVHILLGMSFLKYSRIEENNDTLKITRKY